MKILVVTSSYPRFIGDVAGRFVHQWASHLRARGHQLRVLSWADAPRSDHRASGDLGDVIRVRYAPHDRQTLFYGPGSPETLRRQPKAWLWAAPAVAAMVARALAEVARWRPDVVVGHWMVPGGLIARAVGRLTGTSSVVVSHSGGVHLLDRLGGFGATTLTDFITSGPTTAVSAALAHKIASLQRSEPNTPHILPMGVVRPPVASGPAADARGPHWLVMGRLVEIKAVELAIRAFRAADLPEASTLHIAGDGPQRGRLEAVADTADDPVRFHGFVSGARKQRLLEQCNYVLITSKTLVDGRHEGLPVSFLEACSRGLIPLCARVPGIADYLVDRGLQQMAGRDPLRWARRMESLAEMGAGETADLANAQRRRVAPLHWPQLIGRWERLLVAAARR